MASSLQPQLKMLISSDDFCGNLSTSYLRSVLDCAYAFGGTAGIFWGYLADRVGRRPVALGGLFAMAFCCLSMGFATDVVSCTIFRFVAGLSSSTIMVTTLTMIGDISLGHAARAKNVARLPLIALCGSIGPIIQAMVSGSIEDSGAIWQRFPILSSQIACGSLVFLIAVTSCIMLEEVSATALNLILNETDANRPCQCSQPSCPNPWIWTAKRLPSSTRASSPNPPSTS
jgi:MFS family permease